MTNIFIFLSGWIKWISNSSCKPKSSSIIEINMLLNDISLHYCYTWNVNWNWWKMQASKICHTVATIDVNPLKTTYKIQMHAKFPPLVWIGIVWLHLSIVTIILLNIVVFQMNQQCQQQQWRQIKNDFRTAIKEQTKDERERKKETRPLSIWMLTWGMSRLMHGLNRNKQQ